MYDLTKIDRAVRESNQSRSINIPAENRAILLDLSSSMLDMDAGERYGDISRYDRLVEIVADFPDERKFGFNYSAFEIPKGTQIPQPCGGTSLAKALLHLDQVGIYHIILISDGQPQDKPGCIQLAANFEKIDVIYAGPQPAPPFLKEFADAASGQYYDCSFNLPKQLTQAVSGLLTAPKKAIQL